MATIGKLSNAVFKATQENQFSLASLNFDFSIIKYEVPKEYKQLGERLSRKRKTEAEDGRIHRTARKLGALFETEIPEVPALIDAYGRRVSEVAAATHVNTSNIPFHGPFADYIGVDGTTIWASATSGKGVLTLHLLACMLAHMWKGSEAISIWTELVECRRALLAKAADATVGFHVRDLAASRIEITRDELAEWDASARYLLSQGWR